MKNELLTAAKLDLFDGNTNVTTDAGLSDEMKTYYSTYLIRLASPQMVHDQFAQVQPIPKNGGKRIEFRKYDSLPKALTPLSEGVTPNGQKLNVTKVQADVAQYGGYVELSDVFQLTSIDNNLMEATRVIADQASRTLDTITREVLCGGTNVQFGAGTKLYRHLLTGGEASGNDYLTDNVTGLVLDATFRNDYTRMDKITAQLKLNFAAIIEKIRGWNPDAVILMQTLYNPGKGINKAPYQAATNRLNDLIRDYLASHPGAFTIVDVAAAFGTDRRYIAQDSIHPSAQGNERIAEVILQTLKTLGLGDSTAPVILHKGVDQDDFSFSTFRLRLQMVRYLFELMRYYMKTGY